MTARPFQVVKDFEKAVAEYCGAPYCVTVNSCSAALLLACEWIVRRQMAMVSRPIGAVVPGMRERELEFEIPKRTYPSVPMSIIHAGGLVKFRDEDWRGAYQLAPSPIWDCARRFTSGMYREGEYQCVSFHAAKILGHSQGGAILHNDPKADVWFRKARFDGRTEGVPTSQDSFDMIGHHCYMSADVAAQLLLKLSFLPQHNEDLPNDAYPDLSAFKVFQ